MNKLTRDTLGENGNNISFCQIIVKTADVDICGVLVFVVPRRCRPKPELRLVDLIDFTNYTVNVLAG